VRLVGLPGTVIAAALLNLLAALMVYRVARRAAPPAWAAVPAAPGRSRQTAAAPSGPARLLLVVAFGTAVASFVYEIAWIRMLSLVLGSATHSFELMLSAFILGLALGAFWIRGRADRTQNPLALLGTIQCVMGALAVATLPM